MLNEQDRPGLARRRWPRLPHLDWGDVLAVGTLGYAGLFGLWCVFKWGGPERVTLVNDLGIVPLGLAVVLLPWRIAVHPALGSAARRAWRLLGAGLGAFWLGGLLWLYYEVGLGIAPFPSWADAAFLAFAPLTLLGLVSFPKSRPTHRPAFWLDAAIVIFGGGLLVWHLVLEPTAMASADNTLTVVLALAYPIGDLMLLFGLAQLWLGRPHDTSGTAVVLLAVGLVMFVAADLGFGALSLAGTYQNGEWPDAFWVVALGLMATAAQVQWRWLADPAVSAPAAPEDSHWVAYALPYLGAAAAYVLLLYLAFTDSGVGLAQAVVEATPLAVVVFGRQAVATRESGRLRAERAAEAAELRAERRFRALVEQSSDVVTLLDERGVIRYQSPASEKVLGYTLEQIIGQALLDLVHPDHSAAVAARLAAAPPGGGRGEMFEHRFQRADGAWSWLESVVVNRLNDPVLGAVIVTSRDVSERRQFREQLQHRALHDPLTELPNRDLLRDRLEQALRRSTRAREPLALLSIDIDRFKDVNNTVGHRAGDLVLKEVAHRLELTLRASDTVARLGGDEFALLLPGADQAGAVDVVERLLASLSAPFECDGHVVSLGASVGMALFPQHADGPDALLHCAEVAMYVAKRSASRSAVYSEDEDRRNAERLSLAADLRHAITHNQLMLHYQPQVAVSGRLLVSVEALVRWQHPQRGMIPPESFIHLAEETGQIEQLTSWVLDAAMRQCAAWLAAGCAVPVAVNVSANDVRQGLVEAVTATLARHAVPPHLLRLEVTETVVLADLELARLTMRALRARGVGLSIDDFGTGYASLSYLKDLEVDEIKIDRIFVRELASSRSDRAIVGSTIDLGHRLDLRVVAEGVEDEAALTELQALGCDIAQGYHFARPLPPAALQEWFSASRFAPAPFSAA